MSKLKRRVYVFFAVQMHNCVRAMEAQTATVCEWYFEKNKKCLQRVSRTEFPACLISEATWIAFTQSCAQSFEKSIGFNESLRLRIEHVCSRKTNGEHVEKAATRSFATIPHGQCSQVLNLQEERNMFCFLRHLLAHI